MFGLGKKKNKVANEENKADELNKSEEIVVEMGKEGADKLVQEVKDPQEPDKSKGSKKNKKGKAKAESKDNEKNEEVVAPITYKEIKALRRSRYDQIAPKFTKAFVLKNKRTGQIVEIKAASSVHACNIIGWRPRHVSVLETKEEKPAVQPTVELREVKSNSPALPQNSECRGENKRDAEVVGEKPVPPGLK